MCSYELASIARLEYSSTMHEHYPVAPSRPGNQCPLLCGSERSLWRSVVQMSNCAAELTRLGLHRTTRVQLEYATPLGCCWSGPASRSPARSFNTGSDGLCASLRPRRRSSRAHTSRPASHDPRAAQTCTTDERLLKLGRPATSPYVSHRQHSLGRSMRQMSTSRGFTASHVSTYFALLLRSSNLHHR